MRSFPVLVAIMCAFFVAQAALTESVRKAPVAGHSPATKFKGHFRLYVYCIGDVKAIRPHSSQKTPTTARLAGRRKGVNRIPRCRPEHVRLHRCIQGELPQAGRRLLLQSVSLSRWGHAPQYYGAPGVEGLVEGCVDRPTRKR